MMGRKRVAEKRGWRDRARGGRSIQRRGINIRRRE